MTNMFALGFDYLKNNTEFGRALLRGEGNVGDVLQQYGEDLKQNIVDYGDAAKFTYENWAKFWDDFWNPKVDLNSAEAQAALGFQFTPEQIAAAQQYWDEFRMGGDGGEGLDQLTNLIPDENLLNELLNKIETMYMINESAEDLPAGWFSDILDAVSWDNQEGLTSQDVSGFASLPDGIEKAAQAGVAAGMSGISVNLDGYRVGSLVAPYVSQQIGHQML